MARRRGRYQTRTSYAYSPVSQQVSLPYGGAGSSQVQAATPYSQSYRKKRGGGGWRPVGGSIAGQPSNPGAMTAWYEDAPGAEGATAPVSWSPPGSSSQAVYDPQSSAAAQPQAAAANPASTSAWTTPASNPQGQLLTGTSATQPNQQLSYTAPNPTAMMANHPFFDPGSNYQVQGWPNAQFDPNSLAFMNWATNESPEGYYFGLLNQMGLGGLDARSQAAQSMYGDFARGYQAAKAKNIELWFPQFMQMQNIPWLIDQLSNEQLGMNTGSYEGRDRWALRGY